MVIVKRYTVPFAAQALLRIGSTLEFEDLYRSGNIVLHLL